MGCTHGGEGSMTSTQALGRRLGLSSVVVFDLCDNRTFEALRTVTVEADWAQTVLDCPGLLDMGPAIAGIVAHCEGGEFGAEFQYKVVLQYKWRNGAWADAGTLLAATGSELYVIGTEFTDRQKLGMKLRVVVRTSLESGTAIQRGSVSVSVAVRQLCA
jgi:hypothetical protein